MRSGTLFLLPPLVRLTYVIGSGSSRPLPTPTTSDGGAWTPPHGTGPNLMAALLPTPQAQDHRNCADYSDGSRGHSPQLRHLGSGRLNPRFVEWMMGYPPGWTDLDELDTPV